MKFNSIQGNSLKLGKVSSLGLAILLLFFISTSAFNKTPNSYKNRHVNDSTLVRSRIREVLTSQEMFITKLSAVKKNKKGKKINFTAELKDAFKVIRHDVDSSYIELDWLLSSKYGDPKAGVYNEGTAEFQKLDSLITKIKKKSARKK